MTHNQKLKTAISKLQSAEKELAELLDSIPEVVKLTKRVEKARNILQKTIWDEAFNHYK